MSVRLQQVITQLERIQPDADGDCVQALVEVLSDFDSIPNRREAIPALFAVMERYPEADLGSPGPLVHEIEAIEDYESELEASLARNPSALACWMVNRILNQAQDINARRHWITVLRGVVGNPLASGTTRSEAQLFLDHQAQRK